MTNTLILDYQFWYNEYHEKNKSLDVLAQEYRTYPNKIRRHLIKLGVALKNKSEAQKSALAEGRHKHPTAGTTRPKETTDKIGATLATYWATAEPEKREKRSEQGKVQWDSMSDAERIELQGKAARAMRATSQDGSKLEKFLRTQLMMATDFVVEFHKTNLMLNEKLHLDLYVPELFTAIEIDGPTHFKAIWGEESFERTQSADAQKNATLTMGGYNIIRVKHIVKSVSNYYMVKILNQIVEKLNYIRDNGPFPVEERLFWVGDLD